MTAHLAGTFWTTARIERLKQMHAQNVSAVVIAKRIGSTPPDIKLAIRQLGLDAAPTPAKSGGVIDTNRRLRLLAEPTGHTPEQIVLNGWVDHGALVDASVEGDNVSL